MNAENKINALSQYVPSSIGASSEITSGASENTLKVGGNSIERIKKLQEYYIEVGNDAGQTIDNCLEKIEKYENDITELNADSLKLQSVIERYQVEIVQRGQLIKEKNTEIEQLNSDLNSAKDQKSELEKQLKNTQTLSENTAKELREQISKLTETINSLDSQITAKGNDVALITHQKDELARLLNGSEQELKETKQKLELAEAQLRSAQEEFQEINQYIDTMHNGAKKLSEKVNAANAILKKEDIQPVKIKAGLLDFNFDDI